MCLGASSSRKTLMSLSSASSFSVRRSIPVACGAKTCTMPVFMFAAATASWTVLLRSTNSISPLVEKFMFVLTTLKGHITELPNSYLG